MYNTDIEPYGKHIVEIQGYTAVQSNGVWGHYFGGTLSLNYENLLNVKPDRLLTLDLNDPRLSELKGSGLNELPLLLVQDDICYSSYKYRIVPNENKVVFDDRENAFESIAKEDILPSPIPVCGIDLEKIPKSETPYDHQTYLRVCDDFIGADSFIRLLQPIWLDWVEEHTCCNSKMIFVANIGYQLDGNNNFVGDEPFYIGELVLNYFFCKKCLSVQMTSQNT